MKDLISTESLIEKAKADGVDFGKGDPYNRLRYYTKMGWMPYMIRKKEDDELKGHYPEWALSRLIYIEKLKEQGFSNEEIGLKINTKNKLQGLFSLLRSSEVRNKIITYTSFMILILILSNETGIISMGKAKNTYINTQLSKIIMDDGNAFVPAGQRRIQVKSDVVHPSSKIYVTFTQDYSPAQRFWVSEIKPQEGFIVELDTTVFANAEFTWWVSN